MVQRMTACHPLTANETCVNCIPSCLMPEWGPAPLILKLSTGSSERQCLSEGRPRAIPKLWKWQEGQQPGTDRNSIGPLYHTVCVPPLRRDDGVSRGFDLCCMASPVWALRSGAAVGRVASSMEGILNRWSGSFRADEDDRCGGSASAGAGDPGRGCVRWRFGDLIGHQRDFWHADDARISVRQRMLVDIGSSVEDRSIGRITEVTTFPDTEKFLVTFLRISHGSLLCIAYRCLMIRPFNFELQHPDAVDLGDRSIKMLRMGQMASILSVLGTRRVCDGQWLPPPDPRRTMPDIRAAEKGVCPTKKQIIL